MSNFDIDSGGYYNVYIDGSWLRQGMSGETAGFGIFWGPGNSNNISGASKRGATNNIAEIQSATEAIKQAGRLGIRKLRLNTDSKVLHDALTDNITKWKRNGWRSLYDGSPIKNRQEWEILDDVVSRFAGESIQIRFLHGHSGNQYHNQADHLARAGAELRRN